jgi:hypothetical protein
MNKRQREQLEKQGKKVEPNAMGPASSMIQFRNIYVKRSEQ